MALMKFFSAITIRLALTCLQMAMLPFAAFAQVVPLFPQDSQVQNVIDFKIKRLFGELSLRIPLPVGNWTVRFIEPTKSTGKPPFIEGVRIFLDHVVEKKVYSSLLFRVYPHENRNWKTGHNCSGGVLVREIGGGINGYCHSLKFSTSYMTDLRSDWQGKVRKSWRDSEITHSSKALKFTGISEQQGKYVVSFDYDILLPSIGFPEELTSSKNSKTVEDWWKANENTPQVLDVVRWYENYSNSIAVNFRNEKTVSESASLAESVIPKLQRLVQDLQLVKQPETIPSQIIIAADSDARSEEIDALRAEREKLAYEALLERERSRELGKIELAQVKPVTTPLLSERRVALVVGNSGYKNSPLTNPVNDAMDMSATLKSLGFTVTTVQDVNLRKLREVTRLFQSSVASADVALIFYAGHAVEAKGRNFLIPVDADVAREYELEDQAYDMQQWLTMLGDTKGKNTQRVNIVILDACRDNPVSRQWRSVSSGLGRMDAPSGTLLVYSTSPGKVASDGPQGQRNSPFTKSLLRSMQTPNVPVEQVLKDVRRQVLAETKGEQVPWENSSLIGDFVFKRQQ